MAAPRRAGSATQLLQHRRQLVVARRQQSGQRRLPARRGRPRRRRRRLRSVGRTPVARRRSRPGRCAWLRTSAFGLRSRASRRRPASRPAWSTCRRPFSASRQAVAGRCAARPVVIGLAQAIDQQGDRLGRRRRADAADHERQQQRQLRLARPGRAPAPGPRPASGSAAYQYISGRLWSSASSAWATRPSRMSQRWSSGQPLQPRRRGRAARPATDRLRPVSASFARTAGEQVLPFQGKLNRPGRGRTGRRPPGPSSTYAPASSPPVTCSAHSPRSRRVSSVWLEGDLRPAASMPTCRRLLRPRSCKMPAGVADVPVVRVQLVARPAPASLIFCRSTVTGFVPR